MHPNSTEVISKEFLPFEFVENHVKQNKFRKSRGKKLTLIDFRHAIRLLRHTNPVVRDCDKADQSRRLDSSRKNPKAPLDSPLCDYRAPCKRKRWN